MALTFPYPLAHLADVLKVNSITLDLQRSEEYSGHGDGRYWSAELAPPLWTASIPLVPVPTIEARAINARIRALDGSSKTFLVGDPSYRGPVAGTFGLGAVTVGSISAARDRLSLDGMPAGFELAIGEYLSIGYGDGRRWFGEVSEAMAANASGVTPSREVRPHLPQGVTVGDAVELVKPCFKAFIPPKGFTPYSFQLGDMGTGASLTILQKP
jgi:hypothetical protein